MVVYSQTARPKAKMTMKVNNRSHNNLRAAPLRSNLVRSPSIEPVNNSSNFRDELILRRLEEESRKVSELSKQVMELKFNHTTSKDPNLHQVILDLEDIHKKLNNINTNTDSSKFYHELNEIRKQILKTNDSEPAYLTKEISQLKSEISQLRAERSVNFKSEELRSIVLDLEQIHKKVNSASDTGKFFTELNEVRKQLLKININEDSIRKMENEIKELTEVRKQLAMLKGYDDAIKRMESDIRELSEVKKQLTTMNSHEDAIKRIEFDIRELRNKIDSPNERVELMKDELKLLKERFLMVGDNSGPYCRKIENLQDKLESTILSLKSNSGSEENAELERISKELSELRQQLSGLMTKEDFAEWGATVSPFKDNEVIDKITSLVRSSEDHITSITQNLSSTLEVLIHKYASTTDVNKLHKILNEISEAKNIKVSEDLIQKIDSLAEEISVKISGENKEESLKDLSSKIDQLLKLTEDLVKNSEKMVNIEPVSVLKEGVNIISKGEEEVTQTLISETHIVAHKSEEDGLSFCYTLNMDSEIFKAHLKSVLTHADDKFLYVIADFDFNCFPKPCNREITEETLTSVKMDKSDTPILSSKESIWVCETARGPWIKACQPEFPTRISDNLAIFHDTKNHELRYALSKDDSWDWENSRFIDTLSQSNFWCDKDQVIYYEGIRNILKYARRNEDSWDSHMVFPHSEDIMESYKIKVQDFLVIDEFPVIAYIENQDLYIAILKDSSWIIQPVDSKVIDAKITEASGTLCLVYLTTQFVRYAYASDLKFSSLKICNLAPVSKEDNFSNLSIAAVNDSVAITFILNRQVTYAFCSCDVSGTWNTKVITEGDEAWLSSQDNMPLIVVKNDKLTHWYPDVKFSIQWHCMK